MLSERKITATVAIIAAVICFCVYLRALSCDFINWDDTDYLLNNQIFRSLDMDMLVKAFTTIPINYWIPLTWVSYAIDYYFWGMNPTGYHLTNVIIHSANVVLFVLVAKQLYRWRPDFLFGAIPVCKNDSVKWVVFGALLLLAALLWGIHPARVESVVWATERKDVLNGFFLLGSLYFYLRYSWQKSAGKGSGPFLYVASLSLYACSLMAKPSGVVLPLLLLILDWYPGGRYRKGEIAVLLVEKVPFLLFAAAVALITILVGSDQSSFISFSHFSVYTRFIVIGTALFEYCKQIINPASIIPYYHLPFTIPSIYIIKAFVAYSGLVACFYVGRHKPWFIAALLSFLVTLLPVLQLFPNGFQTTICTRYTYISTLFPSILIAILLFAAYCKALLISKKLSFLIAMGLFLLLIFYGTVTQRLIGDWQNSGTFWSRVIETQPFERAYFYRGLYYVDEGNYQGAINDYTTTLDMLKALQSPEFYNLYAFRGEALSLAGRFEEAVADFDRAIAIYPHRLYYYHRAEALKALGRIIESDQDFIRAGRAKGQMCWFPPEAPL